MLLDLHISSVCMKKRVIISVQSCLDNNIRTGHRWIGKEVADS